VSNDEKKTRLAQSLRKRIVPAESLLWKALRNRALAGFKFRRQHPIGPYIVDFASAKGAAARAFAQRSFQKI